MVTGRPAFAGDTQAAVIAAVMRQTPPAPSRLRPSVPPGLDRLVAACLAKDPAERWQSAGDLARELVWLSDPVRQVRGSNRHRLGPWLAAAAAVVLAAIAGAAGWFAGARESPGPVVRSSVLLPAGLRFPVARTIGGGGRMALSPDGRRMAFIAIDAHGNQTLWVRALDSLMATSVAGTDGASSPFWSPGSDAIAFFAMGQLKIVGLAGGMPTPLASPALDATGSWSRDGVILFTPAANAAIHRVPATGGTPIAVTVLDTSAGDLLHRSPFFLPDGRHFLYVAVAPREQGATGPRALYVGSLDRAEAPRLLVDRGSMAMYAGGHLLFVRDNRLLAQPFDVDGLSLSGEARPVAEQVAFVGSGSAAFSVSSTGTLAYQPSDTGSQLVGYFSELSAKTGASAATPSIALRYRSKWPLRFDEKSTVALSGDHTGATSSPGSSVNRARTPRSRSKTQRSRVFCAGSSTLTTTRRPSGESSTSPYSAGSPSTPSCRPARSNQTSWDPVSEG